MSYNSKEVKFKEIEKKEIIYIENNSKEGKEETWYFYSTERRTA